MPYEVFTVTPGDLESYSESNWDTRMQSLTGRSNYFANQIVPNAVQLDPDLANPSNTSEPALDFSYGSTGSVSHTSAATSTSFRETSWSLEASIYAGVSSSFDLWGLGWEMKAMAGIETSATATDSTEQSTRWGIEVDQTLPVNPYDSNPNAVISFAWKLYLVAASTQWTQELIDGLPDSDLKHAIDPNSACWKIVYTVDPSRIIHGTTPTAKLTVTHGVSDAHVEALKTRGITTCGQMVKELGIESFADLRSALEEKLALHT